MRKAWIGGGLDSVPGYLATATPKDPTAGLFLGPYDGPKGGGGFL